jgi:hypothetical protein
LQITPPDRGVPRVQRAVRAWRVQCVSCALSDIHVLSRRVVHTGRPRPLGADAIYSSHGLASRAAPEVSARPSMQASCRLDAHLHYAHTAKPCPHGNRTEAWHFLSDPRRSPAGGSRELRPHQCAGTRCAEARETKICLLRCVPQMHTANEHTGKLLPCSRTGSKRRSLPTSERPTVRSPCSVLFIICLSRVQPI